MYSYQHKSSGYISPKPSEGDKFSSVPMIKDLTLNKYGWSALNTACYFGRLDMVKYLVEEHRSDPNHRNSNGWHSLIFALMGSTINDSQ